jgi:hypothetical protein
MCGILTLPGFRIDIFVLFYVERKPVASELLFLLVLIVLFLLVISSISSSSLITLDDVVGFKPAIFLILK